MRGVRKDSTDIDFQTLVQQLDADLAVRDGEDHAFYDQFNQIESLKHVIVLYDQSVAVSCGAFKEIKPGTVEIKRMFTLPEHRGKGYASMVLAELEKWAVELGYEATVLETGVKQPEAIALYEKLNYKRIPNYGPYIGIENSFCFQKVLKPSFAQ